jgi:hypothetical protein
VRQSLKDGSIFLLKTFVVPSIMALIASFLIQPWAARYWQRPSLNILGLLPISQASSRSLSRITGMRLWR